MDNLTALRIISHNARATKRFYRSNGEISVEAYANPRYFDVEPIDIDGLSALAKHLETLSTDQTRFVIRGDSREGNEGKNIRRKYKGSTAAFERADR